MGVCLGGGGVVEVGARSGLETGGVVKVCRPLVAASQLRLQRSPPPPTKTNKHALPPFLLLWEKKTTLPPFCCGEQRLIKHRRHFAVGDTYMQDIARRTKKHISLALASSG